MGHVQIIVVDAMMGMGKTSASINFMRSHYQDRRFLFITPYLDEGERIKTACPECEFMEPPVYGSKQRGLKSLLRNKANIVSTHSLFALLDSEAFELIEQGRYTLVMDEVFDAVSEYDTSPKDMDILLKAGAVSADDRGVLTWEADDGYAGIFSKVKRDLESRSIVRVRPPPLNGDSDFDGQSMLLSVMPTDSFGCFEEIYVLTYLFDGSLLKSYFDFYGFSYQYIGVKKDNGAYVLTDTPTPVTVPGLSSLVDIWMPSHKAQKGIGSRKNSLSYSWFKNHPASSEQVKMLKRNIRNYFVNVTRARSGDCLWTTYKFAEKKLSGPGYAASFEAHNIRATNKYRDRWAVVYALNKFISPGIVEFFEQHDIAVDADQYALSTIIQFIWRSAIRDGNPISIYIPSLRMRQLFETWLKEVSA